MPISMPSALLNTPRQVEPWSQIPQGRISRVSGSELPRRPDPQKACAHGARGVSACEGRSGLRAPGSGLPLGTR